MRSASLPVGSRASARTATRKRSAVRRLAFPRNAMSPIPVAEPKVAAFAVRPGFSAVPVKKCTAVGPNG